MIPLRRNSLRYTPFQGKKRSVPVVSARSFLTKVYPQHRIQNFEGVDDRAYAFLTRDIPSRIRKYNPVVDDKPIFRSLSSYNRVLDRIADLITRLGVGAKSEGWPVKPLPETNAVVFDGDQAIDYLTSLSVSEIRKKFLSGSMFASESDIISKFTIQRQTRPGWYLEDFTAKHSHVTSRHREVLTAMVRYFHSIIHQPSFKLLPLSDMSDPIDTNAGWPYFESGPDAKLKTALEFKDVFKADRQVGQILQSMRSMTVLDQARDSLLAMGTNRRSGPMWKWAKVWETATEMYNRYEVIGLQRLRPVYMAPYVYNLGLSPLYRYTKSLRHVLLGCEHSMASRSTYLGLLKGRVCLESDISGFDASMTVEHRLALFNGFKEMIGDGLEKWVYDWMGISISLPYLIPDPNNESGGSKEGVLLTGQFGLFSGIKMTSDVDTFMSLWVIIDALDRAGLIDIKDLGSTMFSPKSQVLGLFQGDDVLLAVTDPLSLLKHSKLITEVYKEYGLSARLSLGDRFLMRHLINGVDGPVLARVLQQTISNEHPKKHPVILQLGMAGRTDGLNRTMSLFGKTNSPTLKAFASDAVTILKEEVKFIGDHNLPIPTPYPSLEELKTVTDVIIEGDERYSFSSTFIKDKFPSLFEDNEAKELNLYVEAMKTVGLSRYIT